VVGVGGSCGHVLALAGKSSCAGTHDAPVASSAPGLVMCSQRRRDDLDGVLGACCVVLGTQEIPTAPAAQLYPRRKGVVNVKGLSRGNCEAGPGR
jgi:hypothetical protein